MAFWTPEYRFAERRMDRTSALEKQGALRDQSPGALRWVGKFFARKPLGALGALVVLGYLVLAAVAPIVAAYDPVVMDASVLRHPPSWSHPLGTDQSGRDVLSRLIWGTRITIAVGFSSVAIGGVIGGTLGLVGAYVGGWADDVIQRFMDSMMALPTLVLGLAIVAVFGPSLLIVTVAIATVITPRINRVVRASAIAISATPFVDAAKAIGCSRFRIIFHHVAPSAVSPFVVIVTAQLAQAIITEASLSFLGVGVPPPNPTWGGMLSGSGRTFVLDAPWLTIAPGVAIATAVFAANMLGDALRDEMDPRLRGQ